MQCGKKKNLNELFNKMENDKIIPVTYKGLVVGHVGANVNEIIFHDDKESQLIKNKMMQGHPIGISSRKTGTVDENGNINEIQDNEWSIIE